MSIKYKQNCKTCMLSKHDPKLRARFYKAAYRREDGDETIADIASQYDVSAPQAYNHVKKHMKENKPTGPIMVEKGIERVRLEVQKELENSFDHEDLVPKEDYEKVIDTVLEDGLAQMRNSGKQITVSQLLAAAKIKGDNRNKRRGQDVEVIKTMYRIMNGHPSETPRVLDSGQD